MTTKRIGIIGAGQAGQRIAVILSKFSDVEITGIVDPTANVDVLKNPDSPWHLPDTQFFIDDDEMLEYGDYDALVVAVDPLSVMIGDDRKMFLLRRHGFAKPILWERPLGFEPDHPKQVVETLRTVPIHSIVSFSRFGLPPRILAPVIQHGQIGDIVDFEILATLNCGLARKTWRHDPRVPQPVHFLDSAFEMIEHLGLGTIEYLTAHCTSKERDGAKFDEKWEVSVALDTGTTGRIVGIQYVGEYESLYALRQVRVIGTSGALHSTLGTTTLFDSIGTETKLPFPSSDIDSHIHAIARDLVKYFRSVDKYPMEAACLGEALALVECIRAWLDGLSGGDVGHLSAPGNPEECAGYLRIAHAAILSAASGRRLERADWELD